MTTSSLNLLNIGITTAVTASTTTPLTVNNINWSAMILQANFTYGSGGTSADAYIQTTLDNGSTWVDLADFHFTTSSGRVIQTILPATAISASYTATDGAISANTAKSGIMGDQIRVKYTTVGTYAASTTLVVSMIGILNAFSY